MITIRHPTKPNSSPITVKIKSCLIFGDIVGVFQRGVGGIIQSLSPQLAGTDGDDGILLLSGIIRIFFRVEPG